MGWTGALAAVEDASRTRFPDRMPASARCGPDAVVSLAPVGAEDRATRKPGPGSALSAMPPGQSPLLGGERRHLVAWVYRAVSALAHNKPGNGAAAIGRSTHAGALAGDGPLRVLTWTSLRDQERCTPASGRARRSRKHRFATLGSRARRHLRGAPQGGRGRCACVNSWPAPPTPIGSALQAHAEPARLRRHKVADKPGGRSAQTASAVRPARLQALAQRPPRPNWKSSACVMPR